MSTFAVSVSLVVVAFLIILVSWFLVSDTYKNKFGKQPSFAFILAFTMIAFVLGVIAHANIYFNGTEEELLRWMFWFRG